MKLEGLVVAPNYTEIDSNAHLAALTWLQQEKHYSHYGNMTKGRTIR